MSHVACVAIEKNNISFAFLTECAKNYLQTQHRNASRRARGLSYIDGEAESVEEKMHGGIEATQDVRVAVLQCLREITKLPIVTQKTILLAAEEYSSDEIASTLGIAKSEVNWRLQVARKRLRSLDGWELPAKRGHARYVGIRRDRHRWVAAIRKGEIYEHLGQFGTAADAARAYDEAAQRLFGASAKRNFPVSG